MTIPLNQIHNLVNKISDHTDKIRAAHKKTPLKIRIRTKEFTKNILNFNKKSGTLISQELLDTFQYHNLTASRSRKNYFQTKIGHLKLSLKIF